MFKGAHKMIRLKMISINASSEAILRNFALRFRIYKKIVWRNLTFAEKEMFLY